MSSQQKSAQAGVRKSRSKPKKANSNKQRAQVPNLNVVVKAPVATSNVRRNPRPRTQSLGRSGDIRVRHREYIADLNGSIAFALTSYAVNPGLETLFPWLSSIAHNYESYSFDSLRFLYETEAPSSTAGTVLLALDYDASDPAPENKSQAMSYRNSVRSAPWAKVQHQSDKEDLSKRKSYYTRRGLAPANTDIKLYDVGNFFACTQGMAGATAVGELYVEYDVRLMTPQLTSASLGDSLYATFTGSVNSAPFATAATSNNLPVSLVSSGTTTSITTFTFAQAWQGVFSATVSGTTLVTPVTTGSTATVTALGSLTNAGASASIITVGVTAQAGQTLIITIGNATISANTSYFAQGDIQ